MTLFCPQSPTVVEQSESGAAIRSALAVLRHAPLTIGLEREAWRIEPAGCPARSAHPFAPGADVFPEGQITVDFAENQAELVTTPAPGAAAAVERLGRLHGRLYREIPGELLWPMSTPGCWGGDVAPARFGDAAAKEDARRYRRYLAAKYGTARQAISGVHFNVSLPEAFWTALAAATGSEPDRSALYFAAMRHLVRYRYVLTYLFGASPLVDRRWGESLAANSAAAERALLAQCGQSSSSLRSSPLGYQLPEPAARALAGVWAGLDAYARGLRGAIADGLLAGEREFYAPVRPKTAAGGSLAALERRGVEYLEIRVLDLDPFAATGVAAETLQFLEAFTVAALLRPSRALTADDLAEEARLNTWATLCSCGAGTDHREIFAARTGALWAAVREAAALLGPEHEQAVARNAEVFAGREPRIVDRFFWAASAAGVSLREQGLRLARGHRKEFSHD
jgi:glutamate--cysteine ligase